MQEQLLIKDYGYGFNITKLWIIAKRNNMLLARPCGSKHIYYISREKLATKKNWITFFDPNKSKSIKELKKLTGSSEYYLGWRKDYQS